MGFRYEVEVLCADYEYSNEAINRRRLMFAIKFEGRVFMGLLDNSGVNEPYYDNHDRLYIMLAAAVTAKQRIFIELSDDLLRKEDAVETDPLHDYLPHRPLTRQKLLSFEVFGYKFRRRYP